MVSTSAGSHGNTFRPYVPYGPYEPYCLCTASAPNPQRRQMRLLEPEIHDIHVSSSQQLLLRPAPHALQLNDLRVAHGVPAQAVAVPILRSGK